MTLRTYLIALLLFNFSLNVQANEAVNASMIIDNNSGNYIVFLSEKSALDNKYNSLGMDRRRALKKVTEQQDRFIKTLKAIDTSIVVSSKSKLIENSLHVRLPHRIVKTIQQNSNVIGVEEVPYDKKLNFTSTHQAISTLSNRSHQEITVAIVGNGIDYTHSQLGGSGKQSNYQQAVNINKVNWQNFPNSKIIGGMTLPLSGEFYQAVNYNPIENTNDLNVTEGFYPSGTVQASLILKQAPKANIIAYKTSDLTWKQLYPSIDLIIDPNQDGVLNDGPDVLLVNFYDNKYFKDESNTKLINKHINKLSNINIAIIAPNNQTGDLLSNTSEKKMMISKVDLISDHMPPHASITGAIVGSGNETREMDLINGYIAAYYTGFIAQLKHNIPERTIKELKAFMVEKNELSEKSSVIASH